MSPSMRGGSPGLRAVVGCSAGNDSTLVGLSTPRQLLLRVRIPGSSVSITASSASPTSASTLSAAAAIARWMTASAAGASRQQSATTRTSVMGMVKCDIVVKNLAPARWWSGRSLLSAGLLLRRCFIGRNDSRDQFMADHVFGGELHLGDTFDAVEQPRCLGETGGLSVGQVDLRGIARDDHAAVLAESREEHLHLHGCGVLCLVQDNRGTRQRTAAHEGERCDLDLAGLQRALDDARVHQIVQRVVDRP